jgi:hypothetical protein
VRIIVDVRDEIAVGDGSGAKSSIDTAWTPTVVLLGHDMQGQ